MPELNPTYTPPLPEHLDFDRLRDRAIGELHRLTGYRWTDFNAHDPGLTLLEALCFALTDLGYRAGYPVSDWLAEGQGADGLPPASAALSTAPVSESDWRHWLIHASGHGQARMEDAEASVTLYYYPEEEAISLKPDVGAIPVPLRGILQPTHQIPDISAIRGAGTDHLPAQKNSAADIWVSLEVEIAPEITNPDTLNGIYQSLYNALKQAIEAPPRFRSVAEAKREGYTTEEVFEGPLLDKGILDKNEMPKTATRTALYASDLIGLAMRVQGVAVVRTIELRQGTEKSNWVLALPVGKMLVFKGLQLSFFRKGTLMAWSAPTLAEPNPPAAVSLAPAPTPPRRRNMGRYHSIRHHLPLLYGLYEQSESPARTKQLSAYLLFFEQILSNSFGHLSEAANWFDPSNPNWGQAKPERLAHIPLAKEVWKPFDLTDPLEEGWNPTAKLEDRQLRFWAHWLARFGEQLPEAPNAEESSATRIEVRRAFWAQWLRHSAQRGLGPDTSTETDHGGLAHRISAALGLTEAERFYMVEHILLRPIAEDVPDAFGHLLTQVKAADPYALQITFVYPIDVGNFDSSYPIDVGRFDSSDFIEHFQRVVREETPAHLKVYFLGLPKDRMPLFRQTYQNWRKMLASAHDMYEFRVRRDALIDQLYTLENSKIQFLIGWPVPILDLKILPIAMVAHNLSATIVLPVVQPGVIYQLCDRDGIPIPGISPQTAPESGTVTFNTPALPSDTTFRVLCTKTLPGASDKREGLLDQRIYVRVGIRDSLNISLKQAEIDFDNKAEVFIGDDKTGVLVGGSQAEVEYALFIDGAKASEWKRGEATRVISLETTNGLTVNKVIGLKARRVGTTNLFDIKESVEVRVRPNKNLEITTNAVVNHDQTAQLILKNAQQGVSYQIFYRPIADIEFDHRQAPAANAIRLALPDGLSDVYLDRSQHPAQPTLPMTGWQSMAAVAATANGDLPLTTEKLQEDTWIRIQAIKPGIVQTVFWDQLVPVLVRPNPNIQAALIGTKPAADGIATVDLNNPQAGVFYRLEGQDNAPASRLYFVHDANTGSPRRDIISSMKVGIDFVVGPPAALPLRIESNSLNPVPSTVRVVAIKAQSKLFVALASGNIFPGTEAPRSSEAPPRASRKKGDKK